VTPLNDLSAKTFRARNNQSVLLSYEIAGKTYPLSIFFIESETLKFGHSTLLLPEYSQSEILPMLQDAARRFFAKPEEELLSSLHSDWTHLPLTSLVDRRIFWDQELSKDCTPEVEESVGLNPVPVLPSVYHFNNPYFKHLLEVSMPDIQEGQRVLVMGCGVGLDAVVVARKTKTVVDAVDINPLAVLNTSITAARAGLSRYINTWQSDVFSLIHEKYDAIIFNAPLVVSARPDQDTNRFDYNGRLLSRFLTDFPAYLQKSGRVYLMSHPDIQEQPSEVA
jgi:protein-L-isoaspartate O-methyltransferase